MAENNLRVNILANVKNFEAAMSKASSRLNAFGKRTAEIGKNLSMNLTLPIGLAAGAAIKLASDFEETNSKFNTVFSSIQEQAQETADEFDRSFGLSSLAARQLLSDTGDLLVGFGFTETSALNLSKQVNELAVDLASFTNFSGGAEGASLALTKALLGERESIKQLGIAITEADLKEFAADQGLVFKELNRVQKATLTFQLAQKQSSKAVGDFARTNESFANKLRQLKSDIGDVAVEFGQQLLPVAEKLVDVARDLAQRFSDLEPKTKKIITVIGLLAAGIGPVLIIVGKLSIGIGAVAKGLPFVIKGFKALNLAMRANPIIAVASALLLVAGAFIKIGKARREAKLNDLRSDMEALSDTEAAQSLEDLNKQLDEENKKLLAANDKRGRGRQKAQELSKRVIKDLETRIDLLTDVIEKRKELNETIQPDPILTGDSGTDDAPIRSAVKSVNELAESTSNAESKFAKLGKQSQITGTILTQTIEPLKEKTTQFANAMTFLGQEIMNAFANAFESMMNGEPFFKTLGKSILGLIKKLVAAATAALVLSTLLGGIGVGKIGMTVSSFKGIFGALTGFAKGGLVTGPTLGLVGEGIGTNRGNPEVIAPLDRLQNMIQPKTQRVEVGGQFSINGQDLVLVLQRANSDRSRLL